MVKAYYFLLFIELIMNININNYIKVWIVLVYIFYIFFKMYYFIIATCCWIPNPIFVIFYVNPIYFQDTCCSNLIYKNLENLSWIVFIYDWNNLEIIWKFAAISVMMNRLWKWGWTFRLWELNRKQQHNIKMSLQMHCNVTRLFPPHIVT